VSLARVQEILQAPVEVREGEAPLDLPRCRGAVALEGVTVRSDRGPLLDGVTLQLAAGERVAIVGESGAGKSTIAELLVRHADPDAGVVRLDGHDLRALRLDAVRRWVLVVETDPFVFHASLADNLRVASPDASDAALREALQLAALGPWLAALPQGLATVLGERGRAMSTGERQRLALARAILADPRVLVLDEATGALDPATEAAVLGALDGWLASRTVVLITHRAAVAALAPRIIVVRGGRVVADGETAAVTA